LVVGCGESKAADKFGHQASAIQGCQRELSVKRKPPSTLWAGAENVRLIICGPPDISDGKLLEVATYRSPGAAQKAARALARRRMLCVVGESVIESWMYPYDASDEPRADKQAMRWADGFCKQVDGRSIGRFYGWRYSFQRRRR
jgi:hypothetical protein